MVAKLKRKLDRRSQNLKIHRQNTANLQKELTRVATELVASETLHTSELAKKQQITEKLQETVVELTRVNREFREKMEGVEEQGKELKQLQTRE